MEIDVEKRRREREGKKKASRVRIGKIKREKREGKDGEE